MLDHPSQRPDPLSRLEDLIAELPAAHQRAQFGESLASVSNWLQARTDLVASFTAMVAACSDLRASAAPGEVAAVQEALEEVLAFAESMSAASDSADLTKVKGMFGDVVPQMTQCQRYLRKAAHDLVQREFLPLRSTGELIKELEPTSTLGKRLVDFAARAASIEQIAASDFANRIRSALAEAAGHRAEVEQLTQTPEHKQFMNALVRGDATLADVTPAVLGWLRAMGALERFVVRPQSQAK